MCSTTNPPGYCDSLLSHVLPIALAVWLVQLPPVQQHCKLVDNVYIRMRSFRYSISVACLVSILLCLFANSVSNPGGGVRFALCRHSTRLSTYPRLRSRLRIPSHNGAELTLSAGHGCSIPRVPALSMTERATFTAPGSVALWGVL
jgi:hypothetical protein